MNQNPQLAPIQLFEGNEWHAFGHAALGAASILLPTALGVILSLGFLYYELGRAKETDRRIAALGEFATGLAVGELIRVTK